MPQKPLPTSETAPRRTLGETLSERMAETLAKTLAETLGSADWLTADRAQAYARVLLALFGLLAAVWLALSHGGVDAQGKAIGTDFNGFWTASKLLLDGVPTGPYSIAQHMQAQAATFGRDVGYVPFFYPPVFLLVCMPLALLPYGWSLLIWLGLTGAAYFKVVRSFAGASIGTLPILAFPAVWINLGHGQNGFLSAALLGGGALLIRTRPVVAGICFGCLVYKPHLALAVPVALVAAGRWDAFFAAGLTALGIAGVSYVAFGAETWDAFFRLAALARVMLEQGLANDAKVQSIFAAVRLLGGSLSLAYGLHTVMAAVVCGALVHLHRRASRSEAEGPALVAAALVMSPYLFDYDLTILAIPLAWCTCMGLRDGFVRYEKVMLGVAFLLPLVSRTVALNLGLPLAPLVLLAVFALVMQRGLRGTISTVHPTMPRALTPA